MSSGMPLKGIMYILKAKQQVFESIWRIFITFVKGLAGVKAKKNPEPELLGCVCAAGGVNHY